MLTTAVQCTEIVTHLYSLLANQCSRFILQELGLLEELDNHIYVNSTLHAPSKSYDQNLNPILVEDRFICNFDMKHSSLGLIWDNNTVSMHMDAIAHRRDRFTREPILMVPKEHIALYDSILPFNLSMNCTISFRDYAKAHEVIDRFHLRFDRGEMVAVPNLSYDFPVPKRILMTLWALASTMGVSKKCFPEWVKQYSNGTIKRIVTNGLADNKCEWVINRSVFQSLIKIDYDFAEPEKEGLHQGESLGINFTATLHASRPSVLYVDYPIIVNNTLVPDSIVTADTTYQHELYRVLEHPQLAMDPVYQSSKFILGGPVRNPWYDDWRVPESYTIHSHLKTEPFFIGAFTLDIPDCEPTPYNESCSCCCEKTCHGCCKCNTTTDINLHWDLDMYNLTDKLKKYFRERKDKCLNVESIYNISVFVDNTQMDRSLLEFDGVVLKVSNVLGPHHIYRLVLGHTPPRHVDSSMAEAQGDDPYKSIGQQVYRHPFFMMLDCLIINKHEGEK